MNQSDYDRFIEELTSEKGKARMKASIERAEESATELDLGLIPTPADLLRVSGPGFPKSSCSHPKIVKEVRRYSNMIHVADIVLGCSEGVCPETTVVPRVLIYDFGYMNIGVLDTIDSNLVLDDDALDTVTKIIERLEAN